jgi:hypothetical protein
MNRCEYIYDFDCEECEETGYGCETHIDPVCGESASLKHAGRWLCEQHYDLVQIGDFGRIVEAVLVKR